MCILFVSYIHLYVTDAYVSKLHTQHCVHLSLQIIGLLLLAIGIWIEDVRKDYASINDALSSPSILAIVVGIFMVITALIGLVGAVKENLVLLKVVSSFNYT